MIKGLRTGSADLDGDGEITFDELFSYIRRSVEATTGGSQKPRLFSLSDEPVVAGTVAQPIFLSYSRSDAGFAATLMDELVAAGHKAWMDTQGIVGGDDWISRIGTAIDQSKMLLVVLSPDALASPWVRRELGYAHKVGKPILPAIHKSCNLPAWFELQFGEIQRLDLTDAHERQVLLTAVSRTLRRNRG